MTNPTSNNVSDKKIYLIIEEPYFSKPNLLSENEKNKNLNNLIEATLELDSSKILEESYSPSTKQVRFKAILQEADVPNKNGRIYPSSVLKQIVDYFKSYIEENGGLPSEVDHPLPETSDPQVQAKRAQQLFIKNSGVLFTNIDFVDGKVIGEGITLDNIEGHKVYSLIKEGFKVGFSLRAFGDVKPVTQNGHTYMVVNNIFKPITYDTVINQSHHNARLIEVSSYSNKNGININESETALNPETLLTESIINPYSAPVVVIPDEIIDKVENDYNNEIPEEFKHFVFKVIRKDLNTGNTQKIIIKKNGENYIFCVNDKCLTNIKLDDILNTILNPVLDRIEHRLFNIYQNPLFQQIKYAVANGATPNTDIKLIKISDYSDNELSDDIDFYDKLLGKNIPDLDITSDINIDDIPDIDDDLDDEPKLSIVHIPIDVYSETFESVFETYSEYKDFLNTVISGVEHIKETLEFDLEDFYSKYGNKGLLAVDENELFDTTFDTLIKDYFKSDEINSLIKENEELIKESVDEINYSDIESIIFETNTDKEIQEIFETISEEMIDGYLTESVKYLEERVVAEIIATETSSTIAPPLPEEEEKINELIELLNTDKVSDEKIALKILPDDLLKETVIDYLDFIDIYYLPDEIIKETETEINR